MNATIQTEYSEEEGAPLLGDKIEIDVTNDSGGGTSWYGAVFLMVNAALGAGLLNFPYAYHEAGGVLVAILIQTFLVAFVVGALFILVYCSDLQNSNNYQEVVHSMCGTIGLFCCSIAITLYCFGTCIIYLVLLADQWQEFFIFINAKLYCVRNPWYMHRMFIIPVTSFIIILPLCFPKKIDFLKYVSIIGALSMMYIIFLVSIKYFLPHPPPGHINTRPKYWTDGFYVMPTLCFAYHFHVSVIPIYSCMSKRTMKEFSKSIFASIFLCLLAYTGMATFGYLTFGALINNDILLSYEPDKFVIGAVLLLIIKTYTTYPLSQFCGKAGLDSLWCHFWNLSVEDSQVNEVQRRVTMTILWFLSTLILALFIPNIGVVIGFLGCLSAGFIFIFPGLCILQIGLRRTESTWKSYVSISLGIFYLLIGAFIFGVTLSQSILKDVKGIHAELPSGCKHFNTLLKRF